MSQFVLRFTPTAAIAGWVSLAGMLVALAGCGSLSKADAEAQRPRRGQQDADGPVAVDVAIARTALLQQDQEYTGTTQPYRQVSLRPQVEGQIVDLSVDVGDPVTQGQVLGRLDDAVLTATVVEAEAEVAARQSEVARAQAEVSNARTRVVDAQLRLQQTQSDLARLEQLFREGAIPEQQVENARTAVATARQTVRSAQEQVRTQQQAVVAAQQRVTAQQAIVAQQRQRQSFSVLTSPVTGAVLERVLEPGNLAQPGSEILKLGDFSQVKVAVQVSERELGTIQVGQLVRVRLDAFPNQQIVGRVSRVSPAADPTSRLIPVEVTIPNQGDRIGSGLLARVNFNQQAVQRVVVPETALQTSQENRSRQQSENAAGAEQSGSRRGGRGGSSETSRSTRSQLERRFGMVFVLNDNRGTPTVKARQVTLGRRQDGKVEILSGLQVGDRYVTRSSQVLKDGTPVKLSILSEGRRERAENRN
ncbi:RND family efflux transporter, MFP subunit [Leptolyngbyaceae cyanobacterium JSC-12]|nr:RND family efflux transporter, MFP subunit [Leptolyngbyaceae cyanobacterium JSC-12]